MRSPQQLARAIAFVAALSLGAASTVLLPGCQSAEKGVRIGEAAPAFVLSGLDGKVRTLANYRGRAVLLNLWATWCPPCIAEMPLLETIEREFTERGLAVVSIAGDDTPQDVVDFIAANPVSFEVLLDPDGAVGTQYGITGYPETFLIDRDGKVRGKFIGPLPSEGGRPAAKILRAVEELVGG